MGDVANPVIPVWFDLIWSTVAAIAIVLAIGALITLARNARRLSPNLALIWTLVILLVPVLGPVSWLMIGRRAASIEHRS
jgi:hypothetical protein